MSETRWSPECDKIAAALVAFQQACGNVPKGEKAKIRGKSKSGNEYEMEYSYADLAACINHARPHLVASGLTVVQPFTGEAVTTRVLHVSGQFCEGTIRLPAPRNADDAQAWGSMITYFRRYAFLATLGIAAEDEDDDGATATQQARAPQQRPAPAAPALHAQSREERQRPAQAPRQQAPATQTRGAQQLPEDWSPRFGQLKGRPIGEGDDEQLAWLSKALWENVEDPGKARYQRQNKADAETVDLVIQRRKAQRLAARTGTGGPLDGTGWDAVLAKLDRDRPDDSLDVGNDPAGLAGGYDRGDDPDAY